jgi:transcriptional regulator NrdR family protein
MVCLYCGAPTQVTNSRHQRRSNQVWRRRKCEDCNAVLTTIESFDYSKGLMLQTPTNKLIPFKKEKLFLSIYKSCEHRKNALDDATALTQTVLTKVVQPGSRLAGQLPIHLLASTVFETLKNFDKVSAIQYSAFHSEYVDQNTLLLKR